MSDNWRSEWSRHYDQIQWIATTVFTTGISILLTYSYSQPSSNIWISSIGLWLTLVTLFYAVSFRDLRYRLHVDLPEESTEREFLLANRKRPLAQWPIFFLTLAGLSAAWLREFYRYKPWTAYVGGAISFLVFIWAWCQAKGYISRLWDKLHATKQIG